jgi:eukaryotic-like serine/threonine-protein kinase
MTAERWQQIKEIFHAALERAPGERASFLDEVCAGDEPLRREVEALIAADEKEGGFIDTPAYEMAAEWFREDEGESLVGRQLNHYEVLARLGTGGMGEVYLAQDNRLGRRIALKLLPASFTSDADRLHRFQQEARTASALNHPNILTIHEIGEQQGRHFIATELIEGETLRLRLSGPPLEPSEALDISLQTASALAAAHEAGIVHRDIKPENIMLRRDGYVKLLDFGLAKPAEPKQARTELEAPTRIQVNTSPGMVLGTVNYMSPEQARGLEVDERTDIWSLGVVLYEMLAGQTPFQGETPTDVTVSILEREPVALTVLRKVVPAELDWIVRKALRKEREERYQTIREMLLDLRAVKQELEFEAKLERSAVPDSRAAQRAAPALLDDGPKLNAMTAKSVTVSTDEIKRTQQTNVWPAAPQTSAYRLAALVALVGIVGLALVGVVLYGFLTRSKGVAPFQAMNITRLTNHGRAISATISPDGKYFVYVLSDAGRQSIWIRQTSAANDTQIVAPAPVGIFGTTFSRDGNELYYVVKANDAGTLYRIPVLGGTPIKLLEGIDCPISFSPDGRQIAYVRGDYPGRGESSLLVANADGSAARHIAVRKLPELFFPIFFTGPSWSPDGRLIACPVTNARSEGRVILISVEDGREQVIASPVWSQVGRVEWLPEMNGLLMAARDQRSTGTQIWYLPYPDGEAGKITNDLSAYRGVSLTTDAARLVTVQTSGIIHMWVSEDGDAQRAVQLPGSKESAGDTAVQLSVGNVGYLGGNESISWTTDGRIVFISATGKHSDIWIMNADGSNRKQLTFGRESSHNPVVSPDDRYIVFTSERAGARNVWRMNIDGSDARQLTAGQAEFFPAVTPDGRSVVYSSLSSDTLTLWKVSIDGGTPVELINRQAINAVVSPDGKQLAYLFTEPASIDGPPNRIAVIPIEGGEPVKTFNIQRGGGGARTILRWSTDGRSLLYTVINNNVSNIWSQPLDGRAPLQLTNFKDSLITAFDWSRDGRKLACSRGLLIRDAVLITHAK